MSKQYDTGDLVIYKGRYWRVEYQDGGMIKIRREGVEKMVKLRQVKPED